MGRLNSFLIKSLALVALLGLAGLHTAKADPLTPTATGAGCTGLTADPDPSNTNVICFTSLSVSAFNSGSPLGSPTIDTLFLFTPDSSNLSLALICTSSCFPNTGGYIGNSAELYGPQAFGGTIASPTTAGSSCVIESHTWAQCVGFSSSSDFVQGGTGGNHGGDPADTFALITSGGGNFDVNSASIDLKFNLTPGTTTTPEPSSLLMLGSGLLGLLGFGFRRRNVA
jgi:hypothetical protein